MKKQNTGWGRISSIDNLLTANAEHENALAQKQKLEKGIHSEIIVARMEDMEKKMNDFYARMQKIYPTFRVIDTTSIQNWKNVQIYVTYEI